MIRLALGTVAAAVTCVVYVDAANTPFAFPLGLLAVGFGVFHVVREERRAH